MLIRLPQARQRQNSAQSWRNYTSNTQIISFYLPCYLLTIFSLGQLSNCNLKGTISPISGGERTILRGSLACDLPLSRLLNTNCKDPCKFLTWSEVGEIFDRYVSTSTRTCVNTWTVHSLRGKRLDHSENLFSMLRIRRYLICQTHDYQRLFQPERSFANLMYPFWVIFGSFYP